MGVLSGLEGPFVPMTQHAMRPSCILKVVNDLVLNRRRCVLELGPGASTFYMARALLGTGGRLLSIEHDARWLESMHDRLTAEGLDAVVRLVHAPLVERDWGMGARHWYDPDRIDSALATHRIDLLLVDGPPGVGRNRAMDRYPALPRLRRYLAESATIFLDDAQRWGERRLLRAWEAELGQRFSRRGCGGRLAALRLGVGFGS